MAEQTENTQAWICDRCNRELVLKTVKLNYLNKDFEQPLLCCPQCGQVCIDEGLALGKMLDVERSLEDK